jgi:hypothetical protein
LKKNELEIKRHVAELRDNIRNNWTVVADNPAYVSFGLLDLMREVAHTV